MSGPAGARPRRLHVALDAIRLLAFLLILFAIVDKNRATRAAKGQG